MYRYFLQAADEFFGSEYANLILLGLGLVAAFTLIVLLTPSLRQRLESLGGCGRFWGEAAFFGFRTVQIVLALAGLFLLCALLHVQAGLLGERQGSVTQRNYDAVRTKWGIPHELRMLHASLSVTDKVTEETFASEGSREIVVPAGEILDDPEGFRLLSDESFAVKRDKDNKVIDPLEVARRRVFLRQRDLPGQAVVTSATNFDLNYNPRYLGGAGYPGYDYKANLHYEVVNASAAPALGSFSFALPGNGYGVFDNLHITVDGAPQKGLRFEEGRLAWQRVLPARARLRVEVSYNSRGLEYLRYTPGNFLERCQATMHIKGFDASRLDFPIGGMSPNTDLKTIHGSDFTLNWDLSNAVTNYSIGVIVPSPMQPGFAASVILKQAPLGLALLLLSLLITRWLHGRPFCYISSGLSLVLSYFGYALFAYLSDGSESFTTPYLLALLLPGICGAIFWFFRDGRRFAGAQAGGLYLLFAGGYPLAVYLQSYTGVILNCTYLALTLYVMILFLYPRLMRKAQTPGTGTC